MLWGAPIRKKEEKKKAGTRAIFLSDTGPAHSGKSRTRRAGRTGNARRELARQAAERRSMEHNDVRVGDWSESRTKTDRPGQHLIGILLQDEALALRIAHMTDDGQGDAPEAGSSILWSQGHQTHGAAIAYSRTGMLRGPPTAEMYWDGALLNCKAGCTVHGRFFVGTGWTPPTRCSGCEHAIRAMGGSSLPRASERRLSS